jgi:hypothetical protein
MPVLHAVRVRKTLRRV